MRDHSTRTRTDTDEARAVARAQINEALAQVQVPWDAARTERTLRGLPAVRRKRRTRRAVGGGLAAALLLGPALWLGVLRHGTTVSPDAQAAAAQTGRALSAPAASTATTDTKPLRLADGSSVALLDTRTDVAVEHVDEHLVALHLRQGRARFEVTPRPERVFRVRTAEVTVEVLGTVFEVEQREERTRVQVSRGRVAVRWADRRDVLVAGDDRLFPPTADDAGGSTFAGTLASKPGTAAESKPGAATQVATAAGTRVESAAGTRVEAAPGAHPEMQVAGGARARRNARARASDERSEGPSTSWRDHAEGGDFKSAFPLLPQTDTMASMSVSDLMLAADAARLSGHPRAALPFLTRVVDAHAEDARAPLAAFTLGSVLMHQLGLPREAEAAYAKARATTQSVALAQDALARQVEAASRAGDEALARKLARAYLEQYPDGRRVNAVRRFGRL